MIYKRKLNKKTDYRKRLKNLISRKPRLVIRKSNKTIYVQIISYNPDGDKTLASANSKELLKLGYLGSTKNIPSAYLTGLLISKKAKEKSIKSITPDLGLRSAIKGSIPFAVIKGAKDGGLDLKIGKSVLPDESRIHGKHIMEFTKQKKSNSDLSNLEKKFNEIKTKLLEK